MADDFEDLSNFGLSDEHAKVLYEKQTECTFMWTTKAGEPVGVIMNYVLHEGSFWLTATRRRARVMAARKEDKRRIR